MPDRTGYCFRFTTVHASAHIRTHTVQLCEQVQAIYAHFIEGTITKQIACAWKQFYIKADELYNTVQLVHIALIQTEPFFIRHTLITICNVYTISWGSCKEKPTWCTTYS